MRFCERVGGQSGGWYDEEGEEEKDDGEQRRHGERIEGPRRILSRRNDLFELEKLCLDETHQV